MMFGWCEMDLALGRVRYIPPLQGLGFLWARFPRALPWAITLCPVGAEDRCPVGGEDRAALGAVDVIGSKYYHPARACGTAHMRLFHCRDSIRCSTFCCISSLS
jgi:hypothetical protein